MRAESLVEVTAAELAVPGGEPEMGESTTAVMLPSPLAEDTRSLPDFDLGGRPDPMVSPVAVDGGLAGADPFIVAAPADPFAAAIDFDNAAEAEFCVAAI